MNRHTYYGICRHIWRHMVRATVKSILVISVALSIFLTQGWLQETISRNEREVQRLYESTYVFGRILPKEPTIYRTEYRAGNVIRRQAIDNIIASEIMSEIYFEAATPWTFVTNLDIDTTALHEMLDEIVGDDIFDVWQHQKFLDEMIAIEQLSTFTERLSFTPSIQIPGTNLAGIDVEIEFLTGFDQDSFVYKDENLELPVPIILSAGIMMRNGFELGDTVSVGHHLNHHPNSWQQMTAVVIGVHHHTDVIQDVLLPLSAWEFAAGDDIGFSTLEFIIDPMLNSELPAIRESIEDMMAQFGASFEPLVLDLLDEEIRFVVQTMEENVSLLRLLYPVVIAVSMLIAIALSLFLTLQNAKNVAIMRTFGTTKKRAGLILWIEQIILCLVGLALGLCFLIALDWGFGVLELFKIAGLYLFSSVIGSALGIRLITRHAPLELLQVKE